MEKSEVLEHLESFDLSEGNAMGEVVNLINAQSAEIERLQKDLQTLLKLLAQDREQIERLKALLREAADDIEIAAETESLAKLATKYREAGGVTK